VIRLAGSDGTHRRAAVIPPHESAVRRLAADLVGSEYLALRSLAEARACDDGVVVLEGDHGGQIYAVFPAGLIDCSEERLWELVGELDALARPSAVPDAVGVYFERHALGAVIAGGGGGGVVLPGGWVHDELVQAGAEQPIHAVASGRRHRLGPIALCSDAVRGGAVSQPA
jgi:hypothetical protein